MEKANDAVQVNDKNWIMRAKRWRMEKFSIMCQNHFNRQSGFGEGLKLMLIGKKPTNI